MSVKGIHLIASSLSFDNTGIAIERLIKSRLNIHSNYRLDDVIKAQGLKYLVNIVDRFSGAAMLKLITG